MPPAPLAPVAAPSRLAARPHWGQAWLPGAWSRPCWSLVILAGAALAAVAIGWAAVGGSSAARPVGVEQSDQVAANGVVEGAGREVFLVPETAGALGVMYVRVNQQVEAGTPAQRAQVAVAAAQLKVAEAAAIGVHGLRTDGPGVLALNLLRAAGVRLRLHMGITSSADLVRDLEEQHLLKPLQLQELARRAGGMRQPIALAQELIRREWLTEFQARLLLQGRGRELVLGPFHLLDRLGEGGMARSSRRVIRTCSARSP